MPAYLGVQGGDTLDGMPGHQEKGHKAVRVRGLYYDMTPIQKPPFILDTETCPMDQELPQQAYLGFSSEQSTSWEVWQN